MVGEPIDVKKKKNDIHYCISNSVRNKRCGRKVKGPNELCYSHKYKNTINFNKIILIFLKLTVFTFIIYITFINIFLICNYKNKSIKIGTIELNIESIYNHTNDIFNINRENKNNIKVKRKFLSSSSALPDLKYDKLFLKFGNIEIKVNNNKLLNKKMLMKIKCLNIFKKLYLNIKNKKNTKLSIESDFSNYDKSWEFHNDNHNYLARTMKFENCINFGSLKFKINNQFLNINRIYKDQTFLDINNKNKILHNNYIKNGYIKFGNLNIKINNEHNISTSISFFPKRFIMNRPKKDKIKYLFLYIYNKIKNKKIILKNYNILSIFDLNLNMNPDTYSVFVYIVDLIFNTESIHIVRNELYNCLGFLGINFYRKQSRFLFL